jgi:kynurenine formamidase
MATEEPLRFEPLLERDGFQVSRSPWGADDEIGRLNWVTPESRSALLARADGRALFDLSVDYFNGMPSVRSHEHLPKYAHWMLETPRGMVNDAPPEARDLFRRWSLSADAFSVAVHTGTHIDMLNHVGLYGCCWNGFEADEHLGSQGWARCGSENVLPIFARGVLLDVAGLHGVDCLPASHPITPDELRKTAAEEGVELRRGDVVLIRTGRMRLWPDYDAYQAENEPGITLASARYLCEEAGAMCVGSDNFALEVLPMEDPSVLFPCHTYLLAAAGAQIIEILDLEELAAAKQYEFAFFGFPLRLRGSTGAPLRAVAMPLRETGR